jgi:hypothetical protein
MERKEFRSLTEISHVKAFGDFMHKHRAWTTAKPELLGRPPRIIREGGKDQYAILDPFHNGCDIFLSSNRWAELPRGGRVSITGAV